MFHLVALNLASSWQFIKHSFKALKGVSNYAEVQRTEVFEQGFNAADLDGHQDHPLHQMKKEVEEIPYQLANGILFGLSAYRMACGGGIDPLDLAIGAAAIGKTAYDGYTALTSRKKLRRS